MSEDRNAEYNFYPSSLFNSVSIRTVAVLPRYLVPLVAPQAKKRTQAESQSPRRGKKSVTAIYLILTTIDKIKR